MNRNRPLVVALIVATIGVSACDAVTGSSGGSPIAVGGIAARTKGTGFTTAPEIAFYRVSGATFVSAAGVTDTCFITTYSTATSTGGTPATALSAGPYVSLAIGNRVDSLTHTGGSLDAVYRTSLPAGIPFTPGDSVVITIPGDRAGYPASTFRGRTAEAFTMGQLVVPANGNPINLTWTPATDLNAAMFVTFRYIDPTTSATAFNRQIACSFIDDGTGQVPATIATFWIMATTRDMTAQRVRTILQQIDVPLAYFNIISAFDWPTPTSP